MTSAAHRTNGRRALRVAQRSGALRRAAEEESRRSFLRMVSHELRTPLNSIIGFSEIIARELHGPIGEPRYREHAEIIRESGQKLLKLFNDVIEIARLEARTAELDIRPEDPAALIAEVLEQLTEEAGARRIAFVLDIAPAGMVLADDRAMKTVLCRLLQNAVAFSPEGGQVRIGVRRWRDEVVFQITDTGPGVPVQDLSRILRPFEQGENALVRRTEGAGLGLPIAQLMCQAMGGRLKLSSPPGEGLTATVRMPALELGPRCA